ncbi:helix-turn-helix transcriptional regulator [Gloeothece verrucosa]|uniref:Transcriptional regulator, XRE family n=1 Tax=Gloeothece verrucosa (strain PCC 7822) TaxID=497965 RepID=E0UCC5_GLOV7|nr:helix-turn-helix transcriptional regulator [Gloeothece verrucosa]ADN12882.1 transcriptional regulator, XRE family [Gloeothece verrucosa PCC 7822]
MRGRKGKRNSLFQTREQDDSLVEQLKSLAHSPIVSRVSLAHILFIMGKSKLSQQPTVNFKKLQLKDVRNLLGLTQESFAQALGVKRETVSRWENGKDDPEFLEPAVKLYKLLQEINRSFEDLAIPEKKD